MIHRCITLAAAAGIAAAVAGPASAETPKTFTLQIASGHSPALMYVKELQDYFVPEVTRRVAARTPYKINFKEAYGGSLVKVAETLEGVQTGVVDIGAYCVCFEPSKLYLQNFQYWLPFGPTKTAESMQVARAVYNQVPELTNIYEKKYNQKLLALMGFDNYDLFGTFRLDKISDVKGRKIGGAGPDLPWIDPVGAIPVSTTLPDVYQSLQTGVYDAVLLSADTYNNYKMYEVAPYYMKIGFGSITNTSLTMNTDSLQRLPEDVQKIIFEVAHEVEAHNGWRNDQEVTRNLDEAAKHGAKLTSIDPKTRRQWAETLKDWPNKKAQEADARGLPGSKTMALDIQEAENRGYVWPVRYKIANAPATNTHAMR